MSFKKFMFFILIFLVTICFAKEKGVLFPPTPGAKAMVHKLKKRAEMAIDTLDERNVQQGECECLGIEDRFGYGDECANYFGNVPFCFVSKTDCDLAGISWVESQTFEFDTTSNLVGKSEEICQCTSGCELDFIGDGHCDNQCNNEACGFDNGDCEPCECLGIQSLTGYGDECANHEAEDPPYCYVSKDACDLAGVSWGESNSTGFNTTLSNTNFIGRSEEICQLPAIMHLVTFSFELCDGISYAGNFIGATAEIELETFSYTMDLVIPVQTSANFYNFEATLVAPTHESLERFIISPTTPICIEKYVVSMNYVTVMEEDGADFWIGTCSAAGITSESCECGEKIMTDALMELRCSATDSSVETTLGANADAFLVAIPVGSTNVHIKVEAEGKLDLKLKDSTQCLIGWSCFYKDSDGTYGAFNVSHGNSYITFSGDDITAPVMEEITIDLVEEELFLWAKNYDSHDNNLVITFSHGDNLDCPLATCGDCSCGFGSIAFCDGSANQPVCLATQSQQNQLMEQCFNGCIGNLDVDIPDPTHKPTPAPTTPQPTINPTKPPHTEPTLSPTLEPTRFPECSPGCVLEWKGDGVCDPVCYTENCDHDGGDCDYDGVYPLEEGGEVEIMNHRGFELSLRLSGNCDELKCFACEHCVSHPYDHSCPEWCDDDCSGCRITQDLPNWCENVYLDDGEIHHWVLATHMFNRGRECDIDQILNVGAGIIGTEFLGRTQFDIYLCECDFIFQFSDELRCDSVINELHFMISECPEEIFSARINNEEHHNDFHGHAFESDPATFEIGLPEGHRHHTHQDESSDFLEVEHDLWSSESEAIWRVGEILVFLSFMGATLFTFC